MATSNAAAGLITAMVIALVGSPAFTADATNPDWPCVQRKVAKMTSSQMWDGPPVDDLTQWRDNEAIGKLIPVLASRRVPVEDAAAAVEAFAAAQPQDKRDDALKLLFAGLLSAVNNDRAIVLSGIERFQRRQKARAAEIERQGAEIRQLRERAATDAKARAGLAAAEERFWDVRVFMGASSLCHRPRVPVLIEQRLFELGRGSGRACMIDRSHFCFDALRRADPCGSRDRSGTRLCTRATPNSGLAGDRKRWSSPLR
jgi:hypothetical protein